MKKHDQKKQIIWNVINSLLAGAISFFSAMAASLTDKGFDPHEILTSLLIASVTSSLIVVYKFKDFWDKEQKEYRFNMFNLA